MTGLFLLTVLAIWLFIVNWFAKRITTKLPEKWWRAPVRASLFIALLPLPLADEIIGGMQFKKLCKENSVVHVNRTKATGRTVYSVAFTSETVKAVKGLWVPVMEYPARFVDAVTGEILISYSEFQAEGGRLFPGFDSGHEPLTFNGKCVPPEVNPPKKLLDELGITWISEPLEKQGK